MLKKALCLLFLSIISFPALATMSLPVQYLNAKNKIQKIVISVEPNTSIGELKKLIYVQTKFDESNQLISYRPWSEKKGRMAQIAPQDDEDLFELVGANCPTYNDYKLGKCEFDEPVQLWFKRVVINNLEGFVNRLNSNVS